MGCREQMGSTNSTLLSEYSKYLSLSLTRNKSTVTLIHQNKISSNKATKENVVALSSSNVEINEYDSEQTTGNIKTIFMIESHLTQKEVEFLAKYFTAKACAKSIETRTIERKLKENVKKKQQDILHEFVNEVSKVISVNNIKDVKQTETGLLFKILCDCIFQFIAKRDPRGNTNTTLSSPNENVIAIRHKDSTQYFYGNKGSKSNAIINIVAKSDPCGETIMVFSTPNANRTAMLHEDSTEYNYNKEIGKSNSIMSLVTVIFSKSLSSLKMSVDKMSFMLKDRFGLRTLCYTTLEEKVSPMPSTSYAVKLSSDIKYSYQFDESSLDSVDIEETLPDKIIKQLKTYSVTNSKFQNYTKVRDDIVENILILLSRHYTFLSPSFLENYVNSWIEQVLKVKGHTQDSNSKLIKQPKEYNREIFLWNDYLTDYNYKDDTYLYEQVDVLIRNISGYSVNLKEIERDPSKPSYIFYKVIKKWCDRLPVLGDPEKDSVIKRHLSRKISYKVGKISKNNEVFNDEFFFKNALQNEIKQCLNEIDKNVKTFDSLPVEIDKLVIDIMQERHKSLDKVTGQEYIINLKNAIHYTLPITGLYTKDIQATVELFKYRVMDIFISYAFGTNMQDEFCTNLFRIKLLTEVEKLCDKFSNVFPEDLNKKVLTDDIHNALLSVPVPQDGCLNHETQLSQIRQIVFECVEDFIPSDDTAEEQLQRNELYQTLAQNLQRIQLYTKDAAERKFQIENEMNIFCETLLVGYDLLKLWPELARRLLSKLKTSTFFSAINSFLIYREVCIQIKPSTTSTSTYTQGFTSCNELQQTYTKKHDFTRRYETEPLRYQSSSKHHCPNLLAERHHETYRPRFVPNHFQISWPEHHPANDAWLTINTPIWGDHDPEQDYDDDDAEMPKPFEMISCSSADRNNENYIETELVEDVRDEDNGDVDNKNSDENISSNISEEQILSLCRSPQQLLDSIQRNFCMENSCRPLRTCLGDKWMRDKYTLPRLPKRRQRNVDIYPIKHCEISWPGDPDNPDNPCLRHRGRPMSKLDFKKPEKTKIKSVRHVVTSLL